MKLILALVTINLVAIGAWAGDWIHCSNAEGDAHYEMARYIGGAAPRPDVHKKMNYNRWVLSGNTVSEGELQIKRAQTQVLALVKAQNWIDKTYTEYTTVARIDGQPIDTKGHLSNSFFEICQSHTYAGPPMP